MDVSFKCNCSKERFGNAIIGLGEKEIREMIEEDGQPKQTVISVWNPMFMIKRIWKGTSMKYNRGHKEDQAKSGTRRLKAKPLLIVIGILLFSNLLWFIAWKVTDKSWETGEVVASVDGESIKRETWMAAMEEKIGRETLLELVNNKVMEAAAKKYDIKVSDKEIDLELALIHSVDDQILTGMTAEKEREKISASLILEKILTKDIVVSDEAIRRVMMTMHRYITSQMRTGQQS